MDRELAVAITFLAVSAGCGGASVAAPADPAPADPAPADPAPADPAPADPAPADPASPLASSESTAASAPDEGRSLAEMCAAIQEPIEAALRAQLEADAEAHGMTPEEVLAGMARQAGGGDEPGPPTWRCPAPHPEHYQPQPVLPPRTLPSGGAAQVIILERMDFMGGTERFAYLAVDVSGRPLHLERIGTTSDRGHGQEWGELLVTSFDADGSALEIVVDSFYCVPAGFTDEEIDEPPVCRAENRDRVTCTVDAEVRCERQTEEPEE